MNIYTRIEIISRESCVVVLNSICWEYKRNRGVSFDIEGGCTLECGQGVELLDCLRAKFLKVG